MLDRLTVVCFGGTYALALLSDLARFVVRGKFRWYLTLGLTALAWLVQAAYLGNRGYHEGKLPVGTVFESLMVLSWILGAVSLYLIVRSPQPAAVAMFVLPVVLGLIAAGMGAPSADWASWGGATAFWGTAHGILLLGGALGACVAFVAGLMYLVQAKRLKAKKANRFGFALPSLEQSDRLNLAAITVAFPLLSAGLLIGILIDAQLKRSGEAQIGWTDPKVVSGLLMWFVFAWLLHARYRPEMRGRRVMLLTMVAFGCLAFTLVGVDLLRITAHGRPREATPPPTSNPISATSDARPGLAAGRPAP